MAAKQPPKNVKVLAILRLQLSGKEEVIKVLLEEGVSKSEIARIFKVNRMTVDSFIKNRMK